MFSGAAEVEETGDVAPGMFWNALGDEGNGGVIPEMFSDPVWVRRAGATVVPVSIFPGVVTLVICGVAGHQVAVAESCLLLYARHADSVPKLGSLGSGR